MKKKIIGVLLLWAVCTALLAIPIMIKGVSIVGVFIASAIIWIILFPLIILAKFAIDLIAD